MAFIFNIKVGEPYISSPLCSMLNFSPNAKPSSYNRSSLAVSFSIRVTSIGRSGRMHIIFPSSSSCSTSSSC